MMSKYYAVKKGRHPGIYQTWAECQREISGYHGAVYKSFLDRHTANAWLGSRDIDQGKIDKNNPDAIYLFTDGGSRNHGNKLGQHVKKTDKAAWALLIRKGDKSFTKTGGEFGATNNRMELMALRNALQILLKNKKQDSSIIAILDSHYVLDPIMKHWLNGWQKRGWKTSSGSAVANKELWQEVVKLLPQFTQLEFQWTKGHADNDGNIIVDHLLNETMDKMGEEK
ncbi:ribonuclease H family protein [Limosilactobacillus fastidiosus]|uniref:Ribonuclease H n=1 Tax=Limosilactobacillus fastidiosus TaxID=2759855 RepID=A0A7W3U0J7_9LACO|nr:ribonuclease H family protein [Limosilactobacillus fastidiosus]MBB1062288.1 viroplasmin family protein [Limosilactobacillus fastidiosus]MBB1086644.1 viroplasmin family protein [Limosilactobacillus fastidiosus]MCD7083365.1 ribonuclease H family protein [Limosilactobacillus fastidiosus]MCD7086378.1 ribonuclease H family protein [Limosilactobacillus fastidiosus]MCD7115327.1 ribonuclease H family protein [Limosilactobacillus fastidiosus]